jgi:uncharacterized protein (TIGR02996 family)
MSAEAAFLQAIREAPEDDAPRLVYADWLDDQDRAERAELIRTQCALAALAEAGPRRAALAEREKVLLEAHKVEWTDGAFAEWLSHRKRDCRSPEGHDFCKLVARGVRARLERDRLPEGSARRKKLDRKLEELGERMEDEADYLSGTVDMPFFDTAEFRRGFVERATIQDFAVILFAEAIPELAMLRELEIENDATADIGDAAIERLLAVLERVPLRELDSHSSIDDLDTVRALAAAPGVRRLEVLKVWFDCEPTGDEAVRLLATSPHLTGLRSLELEHSRTFTEQALLDVLGSPTLAGLTKCSLRPNEDMPIKAAVLRRFEERFGAEGVQWASAVE